MSFEEWFDDNFGDPQNNVWEIELNLTGMAWNHQQKKIEELEEKLAEVILYLKDIRGFYARADYDENYFPLIAAKNAIKLLEEKKGE